MQTPCHRGKVTDHQQVRLNRRSVVSAHEVASPGGNRRNKDMRKAGCNAVEIAKHASHSEVQAVDVFDLRRNIADEQSRGRRSALPRCANGFNIVRTSVQELQ